MKQLLDEITDFIVKIEKVRITPNEDKKLMMAWGELAEKAINTIQKNKEIKDNDQLMEVTQQLLDIRLNYLKRVEQTRSINVNEKVSHSLMKF